LQIQHQHATDITAIAWVKVSQSCTNGVHSVHNFLGFQLGKEIKKISSNVLHSQKKFALKLKMEKLEKRKHQHLIFSTNKIERII
jgi:hypothetical protein